MGPPGQSLAGRSCGGCRQSQSQSNAARSPVGRPTPSPPCVVRPPSAPCQPARRSPKGTPGPVPPQLSAGRRPGQGRAAALPGLIWPGSASRLHRHRRRASEGVLKHGNGGRDHAAGVVPDRLRCRVVIPALSRRSHGRVGGVGTLPPVAHSERKCLQEGTQVRSILWTSCIVHFFWR